jgi:exopolysaccharide production protein ExoQ
MNLGFIGLTLVMFLIRFTLNGISKEEKEKSLMLYSFLIPMVINSFTEFGIYGETNYGILFYQLIIFFISLERNTILTPIQKIFLQKRRPDLVLK